jgi:capsular exopolysaccharide synthesis family protein
MKPAGSNNAILDQNDIKKTLLKVLKNWYWFVIFLSLSIAGSVFYLYKSTKYYGASATILIKPQKNAFKDALSDQLPMGPKKEDLANEQMILTSTRLIDEAVSKLNLDIEYYIEGRLKTGEVYKGTPFNVEGKILDPSLYGAPFRITIISKDQYKLELDLEYYKFSKIIKFGEPVVNEKFSLVINGNQNAIGFNNRISDIRYLFTVNDHKEVVKRYQNSLSVGKSDEASIITVLIQDPVPEKAVDFLNTLINLYIENSVSVTKEINTKTLAFIDNELREVEADLNGDESNLEQFQRQRTPINPTETGTAYFTQKMEAEKEKDKLTAQLEAINSLTDNLNSANKDLTIPTSILSETNDATLSMSISKLAELQQKRSSLLFSNTPSSPVVKEVDQQITEVRQNVLGSIYAVKKALVSKINTLSSQVGQYIGTMQQMPSTQRGLTNYSRKVEISEKIYLFLLETRAQTVIAKAAIVADKIILEPASFTGLLKPIKEKILFTGVGIGFALSFLVIFLKGVFMNYIQTKDDLKELTTQPIIGVVGKSKEAKKDYLVVDKFPQSVTSEAFRVIRTNLTYFSPMSSSKIVLVTSSVASEGKTFCAINIATILAKAKKSVILVDLDLHKPKQANAFNLQNDIGVTSFLVGKAKLNQIIKDTPVDNLQIILNGPRTPNASELILDPMLEQLLSELKNKYEYIILDTPPVGLLSDALVLMKYSDLNLYVLKANYSKKDFVEIAHQIIEKNKIKSLSFILNGVNAKNIPGGYGGGYYK